MFLDTEELTGLLFQIKGVNGLKHLDILIVALRKPKTKTARRKT